MNVIRLSENYIQKIKFNQDFKHEILNELFAAVLLNKTLCNETFILGKNGSFPDLTRPDFLKGYEIVQCDLDEDLNRKHLYLYLKQAHGDYDSFLKICSNNNINLKSYVVTKSDDGGVEAIFSNGTRLDRSPLYFLPIFRKNFKNKLKKLNKGNYSKCKDVSLIVQTFSRYKTRDDIIAIADQYNQVIEDYSTHFQNLIIFSTSFIYTSQSNEIIIMNNAVYFDALKETGCILDAL